MAGTACLHNDSCSSTGGGVAALNHALLVHVCDRVQLPLAARTVGTILVEASQCFAALHPTSTAASVPPVRRANVRPPGNEADVVPLMPFDRVLDTVERLKTLHGLWMGAVRAHAGGSRARKAMVADDLLDALQCIHESNNEPTELVPHPEKVGPVDASSGETADHRQPRYPLVSLRKLIESLQAYELLEPEDCAPMSPAGRSASMIGNDANAHDDAQVHLAQRDLAGALLQRDILSPDVGDDDGPRVGEGEGEAMLIWSGGPTRNLMTRSNHPPPADAAGTLTRERTARLFDLRAFPQHGSPAATTDHGIASTTASRMSPDPAAMGDGGRSSGADVKLATSGEDHCPSSAGHQLALQLPGVSSGLSSPALTSRGAAAGGDHSHQDRSQIGGCNAPTPSIFVLSDVDVPRCPRALWPADDVDSDADASLYGTARRTHRRSSTWGLLSSRMSARGPSALRITPSPGTKFTVGSSPMPHPNADRGLRSASVGGSSTGATTPHDARGCNRTPTATRRPGSRQPHSRPPVSVASHQALQQPEYLRYRTRIQGLRVKQFR